jgi:signal transduction histidine kinase
MTISDLLSSIALITLLLIAALTLVDFLRFRGWARLDIALMFGSLASIVLLQGLALAWRQQAPWLTQLGTMLLLSQPYLLLRLVRHFRHVPRPVRWAALLSVVITWLIILLVSAPRSRLYNLLIVANFVWPEAYAALAFWRGALQTGGATRPRLGLAAAGSTLLVLVLVLAGINQVIPINAGLTAPLAGSLACLAMISYYAAFTPPRWLHQSWRLSELQRFLNATAGQPADRRAATALDQLCHAGIHTVAGLAVAVTLWDEASQQLKVERSSMPALLGYRFSPEAGALGRAWSRRQPAVASALAEFGDRFGGLLEATDARAMLIIPIVTPTHAWGALLVFLNHVPLFVSDDLHSLTLLCEQSAIALDYAELLSRQEALVAELRLRNIQVEATNQELEAFSYSVAHDLRAPLRSLVGFSQALLEDYGDQIDPHGRNYLQRIVAAGRRMGELVDGLLALSRITRGELQAQRVDLAAVARGVMAELQERDPQRAIDWTCPESLVICGDARLLQVLLENLLGNAWKYTAPCPEAEIELGYRPDDVEGQVYFVRDTGVGFDMAYADKLFGVFQRLHGTGEFEGTGIGLATAQRIVHRHGGKIWATGATNQGATFFFTLQ